MSRFPNRNYNSVSEVNIILIIRKKVENKLKIQEEYIDRIFRITIVLQLLFPIVLIYAFIVNGCGFKFPEFII